MNSVARLIAFFFAFLKSSHGGATAQVAATVLVLVLVLVHALTLDDYASETGRLHTFQLAQQPVQNDGTAEHVDAFLP